MDRDRADSSDSLLGPRKGASPAYGINEDSEESSTEAQKSGIIDSVRHGKERYWIVAVYALIACLASVLIGLMLGYTSDTGLRLEYIYKHGDHDHGFTQDSPKASVFGVSYDGPFPVICNGGQVGTN